MVGEMRTYEFPMDKRSVEVFSPGYNDQWNDDGQELLTSAIEVTICELAKSNPWVYYAKEAVISARCEGATSINDTIIWRLKIYADHADSKTVRVYPMSVAYQVAFDPGVISALIIIPLDFLITLHKDSNVYIRLTAQRAGAVGVITAVGAINGFKVIHA